MTSFHRVVGHYNRIDPDARGYRGSCLRARRPSLQPSQRQHTSTRDEAGRTKQIGSQVKPIEWSSSASLQYMVRAIRSPFSEPRRHYSREAKRESMVSTDHARGRAFSLAERGGLHNLTTARVRECNVLDEELHEVTTRRRVGARQTL